jgi:hypothetical protein
VLLTFARHHFRTIASPFIPLIPTIPLCQYDCLCGNSVHDWCSFSGTAVTQSRATHRDIKTLNHANLAIRQTGLSFLIVNMPPEDMASAARMRKVRSFIGN